MPRPRILVVDDEESIRHVLVNLFERRGCEVQQVSSAEDALALVAESPPDIALVDMILPGESGMQLLGDIKERSPGVEVIMITGNGAPQTASNAIRLGAFDYLEKPFRNLEHVWRSVKNAMKTKAGRGATADPDAAVVGDGHELP